MAIGTDFYFVGRRPMSSFTPGAAATMHCPVDVGAYGDGSKKNELKRHIFLKGELYTSATRNAEAFYLNVCLSGSRDYKKI
jgi:hypothetical protein